MSKYLTINDAVRAHIDDSAVYYSDATQSLNQLADSMGNEDAHASTIADALDRVLSSSGSGSDSGETGSKEEVVFEKTITLPVDRSSTFTSIYTDDITVDEYNALMSIENSDNGGKCHIEIYSDGYYHLDFICRAIASGSYANERCFYVSHRTYNDLYVSLVENNEDTPSTYTLSFINLNSNYAYQLSETVTIRISKIID